MLIDGPSPEHELVLQGRLEGQAPDIDPVVFLTDCDPADVPRRRPHPGADRRARSGYDLMAAPIALTVPRGQTLHSMSVLYLWVAASSKDTRVGPCPLFVFQGPFSLGELDVRNGAGARGITRRRRGHVEQNAGADSGRGRAGRAELRARDLRRAAAARVDRRRCCGSIIDRPDPGRSEDAGRGGRHRRLPARQPGPERGARRRGRRARARPRSAQQYTLEVSSPGLDRPLRHEADYRRFAGRLAKIVTTEPIERPVGVRRPDRAASRTARWCSKKDARRTGCRSSGIKRGAALAVEF